MPDGNYRAHDLARVEAALSDHQTLTFVRLSSGLYSASSAGESIAATGYASVWVRDNIYIAFAHHATGAGHIATEVVGALIGFFTRYCHRFDDIISGAVDPQDVANRPHVRFDGRTLSEIGDQRWAHARNDALGYFLWLSSTLAASGALKPDANAVSVLTRFVRYFAAIRFWQDEDAALLFLLFPLGVITDETMADLVLHDVSKYLAGEHGIRRYLGDSYWAPDYGARLSEKDRTRDFSGDLATRDMLLSRVGDEAQWCLFDPIASAYYGRRYRETSSVADRERQVFHFNRSLAQITDDWRCAELYHLRQSEYVANPHVPLQWTQANLTVAIEGLRATLVREGP